MKVAYIVGPYRSDSAGGIHRNIQSARKVALKWWKNGYAVICPHLNTAFFDGECEDHVWLDGDIEILKRCDTIVMIDGWKNSSGSVKEYDIAIEYGLEIHYDRGRL